MQAIDLTQRQKRRFKCAVAFGNGQGASMNIDAFTINAAGATLLGMVADEQRKVQ